MYTTVSCGYGTEVVVGETSDGTRYSIHIVGGRMTETRKIIRMLYQVCRQTRCVDRPTARGNRVVGKQPADEVNTRVRG